MKPNKAIETMTGQFPKPQMTMSNILLVKLIAVFLAVPFFLFGACSPSGANLTNDKNEKNEAEEAAADKEIGGVTEMQTETAETKKAPYLIMSSVYSDISQICEQSNLDQWETARASVTGWKHHIHRVDHPQFRIDDETFAKIIKIMKDSDIKFLVESKSTYSGSDIINAGKYDADRDIGFLQRVYDYGSEVYALEYDGAFFDYTELGLSKEQANENLIAYFDAIHEKFPDIKLYFLFNFPNWGWKGNPAYRTENGDAMYMGDAYEVYNLVVPAFRAAGIPLAGFVVDNPYEYAVGREYPPAENRSGADVRNIDWVGRILELEAMVRSDGMEFIVIFNSQQGGGEHSGTFARNTVRYIDMYLDRGGRPDGYELQSWYPNPEQWLPEDDDKTMSGTVKAAAELLKERGIIE
ncbi:MAG: hypothetical protein FWH48_07485 [Oscillospiraceae bacterium]|nr:hypothetical protein [Oscillospiraceae bacterium]